jgi:hypothetical protein
MLKLRLSKKNRVILALQPYSLSIYEKVQTPSSAFALFGNFGLHTARCKSYPGARFALRPGCSLVSCQTCPRQSLSTMGKTSLNIPAFSFGQKNLLKIAC